VPPSGPSGPRVVFAGFVAPPPPRRHWWRAILSAVMNLHNFRNKAEHLSTGWVTVSVSAGILMNGVNLPSLLVRWVKKQAGMSYIAHVPPRNIRSKNVNGNWSYECNVSGVNVFGKRVTLPGGSAVRLAATTPCRLQLASNLVTTTVHCGPR
jgi:hypothetical protein